MLKHILKSGFQQIWRKPLLPVLNMLGLAAGIAVTILILLYAHTELNYDAWVTDQERLYRIEGEVVETRGRYMLSTMTPLKAKVENEISEAENVVRVRNRQWPVQREDFLNYELVTMVDLGFLRMFPLELLEGDAGSAFTTINQVMMSEAMAHKYFGDNSALGQTFTINGSEEYTVSAVFKDLPGNTDFEFEFVIPFQEKFVREPGSWSNTSLHTYVRLKEGANIADVHEKLAVIVDEERPFNLGTTDNMRDIFRFYLQPFGDMHLGSFGRTAGNAIGNYATVYGFLAIAALILIISTFNYVSLAMARAIEREKEFCIRKVTGASFGQIVRHVMSESILQTTLAATLGLLIADDALPYFGSVLGAEYALVDILDAKGFLVFAFATMLLGMLAGLYPAIITSRFRPAKYLSGGKSQRLGINRLRAALVFIQFTVSIALIIGAVTIARQMSHINNIDLGYQPDGLLVLHGINRSEEAVTRSEAFMERIKNVPGVISSARSQTEPHGGSYWSESFFSKFMTKDQSESFRLIASDYNFLDTYGIELTAGRALSRQYANDTVRFRQPETLMDDRARNVVVNRMAVRRLGYGSPETILGEQIFMELDNGGFTTINVVGVVEDAKFESARRAVKPKIYFYSADIFRSLTVRIDPNQHQQALEGLRSVWREMYPDVPYRQSYLVDRIERLYKRENQQLALFLVFSGLTVVLSIVGLIGLVLNSIAHRTKEISIRRVLGASVGDNIKLFTWQYIKPVLIANIPAWLAAYYFLNGWLEKYAQRVEVGPEYYLLGGGTILVITMVLVVTLVLRVASMPPAHALKYE